MTQTAWKNRKWLAERTSAMRLSHIRTAMLGVCALPLVLGGCLNPSSVIVGFDVDLKVASVGSPGNWAAKPEEISKTVQKPGSLDPFGNTVYRGPVFGASFGLTKGTVGVGLMATGDREVCFVLDQTTLSSAFKTGPIAFGQYPQRLDYETQKKMSPKDYQAYDARMKAEARRPLSKLCLKPGEERIVLSLTDMKEFFPSGLLFNASHPEGVARLTADGIGSTVKLLMPIESASGREQVEFSLTAQRSYARATYY